MRRVIAVFFFFVSGITFAQSPVSDLTDSLGLARLKDYSAERVSSGNKYVASNDDSKRIMPGETLVMADLKGAGAVTHIWLTVADNEFGWPRLLRIRVYYDGYKTPSVDAPLGDFFGVGHGSERNLNSIMVHDSSFGRARNSYWPMPYRKSCRITVTNEGNRLVPMFYYHVDYRNYASLPADIGYFHAYYRQERPARKGHNYEFLNIQGTGHYVGTVMSVVQTQVSWFGEGDDLFYVDGAAKPQILGTGSEDYFNDAWGLRDSDGPWTGTPIAEGERLGSRLTGYRWHVPDPIPFKKSLWAGIEHAGWTANPDGTVRSGFEERPDFFSSVAFWYQQGVNQDLPEPPYGYDRLPFGNATQLEVPTLIKDVTAEKGKALVQKEVDWAKDLLFLDAEGPGARINIPVDIPEDGQYELIGLIAQAPDYGDYKALLDDQPMNLDPRQAATSEVPFPGPEVFYNYLPEVYVAKDRALGMATLTKGRHTLSFICVGKDPHSLGYKFGINDVVIEKVPDFPKADPNAPPVPPNPEPPTPVSSKKDSSGTSYRGHEISYYVAKVRSATGVEKVSALYAIGEFGAEGAAGVNTLDAALSDSSTEVRIAAATSLAKIGRANAPAVPMLAKALSDVSPRVRSMAAMALQASGPHAASAAPQLAVSLQDPVASVRHFAADALGAIGPPAATAMPALVERLSVNDEPGFVFASVTAALANMGPEAKAALPALQRAVEERHSLNLKDGD
jgi:Protein of unknown function (DUF2961)/HEAT repeats